MATVTLLSASPHHVLHSPMASRRVPLADNPNAANSPFRAASATKRSRAQTTEVHDHESGQSPPKKKQLLDVADNGIRRVHGIALDDRESKAFGPRPENTPTNAFQRKLAYTGRDNKQREQKAVEEKEKATQADAETIRQWRKHYRKVFPSFVFYLESLPQDMCIRCSRHITLLGAREEKFFSKAITHIVTTRSIPPNPAETDSLGSHSSSSRGGIASQRNANQARTINPSLLEKNADHQQKATQQRSRNITEAQSQGRSHTSWPQQTNSADVLYKAREMGIKIWPLEKFERMMRTIFDTDWTEANERQASRNNTASLRGTAQRQDDLSKLLHNEKAAERPPWDSITPFRGVYIYVHDFEEKTKPSIVRDYANPARKEDGEWPQFRSVPAPRCPFVDDTVAKREESAGKEERRARTENPKVEQQPRTRAVTAAIEANQGETEAESAKLSKPAALGEADSNVKSMPKPAMPAPPRAKTFEPPVMKHTDSLPPQLANRFQLPGIPRPGAGREPMASGLQRSNQTSAIRSQMISSTAANPTARTGMSKEVHQLQRRVVEHRHRSGLSVASVPSSYMNDVRAAINNDQQPVQRRTSRRKPAETMAKIPEDGTQTEEDETAKRIAKVTKAPKKKSAVRRESKPGFCENCKDKYEDFHEHIESRQHRKFALTSENWAELDDLLRQLVRK